MLKRNLLLTCIILIYCSAVFAQTVLDIDSNGYRIQALGSQVWLAENLRVTRLNDGTPIPLVTDSTEWDSLTTMGYCWYNNNDSAHRIPYGALYNWHAVNTSKLCPSGWHVPTNIEWDTLVSYLGGNYLAGGMLKEIGTTHWKVPIQEPPMKLDLQRFLQVFVPMEKNSVIMGAAPTFGLPPNLIKKKR